jgi:hypothetical protein
MLSIAQKTAEAHPLVRDHRRRSLLNPFLTIAAASHWKRQTFNKRSVQPQSWMTKKTPSSIFLKEVGLCLSDPEATDLDQVVALCSLIRALAQDQSNPQGATANDIFLKRLVPPISSVAVDKNAQREYRVQYYFVLSFFFFSLALTTLLSLSLSLSLSLHYHQPARCASSASFRRAWQLL